VDLRPPTGSDFEVSHQMPATARTRIKVRPPNLLRLVFTFWSAGPLHGSRSLVGPWMAPIYISARSGRSGKR